MRNWNVEIRGFLRRCAHGGLSLIILAIIFPSIASAQALPSVHMSGQASDAAIVTSRQGQTGEISDETALGLRPPLPFREPQVGPLIKRAYMDDIEQRTTAFIPVAGSLDNLTPIEFPAAEERWIRVDLSEQLVVAYEGEQPVRAFVISSGLPRTPTVTGTFRIRTKVRQQVMSGEGYYLPNVQWVQYFYADYGFHGTYWHSNFGNPMSRGCINMTNADAKWLFDWAGPTWDGKTTWYKSTTDNPGTLVIVTE